MSASDPIHNLRELVSFKSVSKRSNSDIIDYLEHRFRHAGFDTQRIISEDLPIRANLLCKIGEDLPGGLMLSGHTDVVPVEGQNWDSDPFLLTEKEGRLIGRGAADMKGFIAAVIAAFTKAPPTKLKKPLTLLWTYDEEIGCVGSAHAAPLLKNYLRHLPQAAVVGEPTDFNILRMHAGHVTIKIAAKGKGAHSSDPDLGISAIKALNRALNGIFSLEEELRHETSLEEHFKRPFVILNVGEVHGGTAVNIIPDEAYATLGFRPLPDTSVDDIVERIRHACAASLSGSIAKVSVSLEKWTPSLFTKEDGVLERVLKPIAHGQGMTAAQFATDAGNLSNSGIECLIFGPGTIDVAHQANEWIYGEDVKRAVEKIAMIIDQWFFK